MIKAIKANINDIPSKVKSSTNKIDFKFWRAKYQKEETEKGSRQIHKGFDIDKIKFIECLFAIGFRRFDIDNMQIFIQIVNHRVIRQVSKINIQDTFFKLLKEHYGEEQLCTDVYVEDLINFCYNRLNNLFAEELLYRLVSDETINFVVDTKDIKYMCFQNGFLEITHKSIEFKDYDQLSGFVWESEILARNYIKPDNKEAVFYEFIKRVCSLKADGVYKYTQERINSLSSIIGYNLHTYTETKLKATIFTDSRISNDDEPNGRTGKTLFCKAIGKITCSEKSNRTSTTWVEINGKDFDPTNKNKYQMCSVDTKVVVLNDVRKGFNFEILFNDITEGLTVEKKNMQPYKIHPRIIISTNKTIKVDGSSSKDRAIEFEFGDFFNENRSPADEYGHWFFTDWDAKEWARFDNYMANCCKLYLQKGIIKSEAINLNQRKLRDNTNSDFIEWMESVDNINFIKQSINKNEYVNKADLYNDFTAQYPDYMNKLSRKKFSGWIDYYCRYNDKGIIISDRKHMGKQGHTIQFKINK